MAEKSDSFVQAANEYFDALVKSRFIEMFSTQDYPQIRLGDYCKTMSGGTPSTKNKEYYENGTIPWINSGEVSQGYITSSNQKITQAGLVNSSAKMIPIGSVMIAMYGATVGQVGILKINACSNQAVCSILPTNLFNADYLAFSLKMKRNYFLSLSVGGAQPNISQGIIRDTVVPCPPIELQNQFADFVRQVDKSKLLFQQMVSKYDQLVKSRFIEMFGDPISNPNNWPQNKLNSLVIIERGGSPRPIDAFITEDENGLNWIKIGDANDSFYIESVKEKIRPEGLKKTRQVFKGDLILSNSMSFGRPYILKIDGCIHDGWLLIRDNNKLFDKVFLCIALSQPTVTNYFMGQARGAVVNNLNKDIVGKMPMYIPPIELQNQFADFVRQVDKSKSEILEGIKKLNLPQNN